jgi:3'-5' exoribonuclease
MSGKKVFISELQEGQQVRDLFLVARKNLAETKAGKPYLAMTLMDRTGEIEARVWDNAAGFDSHAEVGNYVLVQGKAKSFRDQLQLGVVFLEQVDLQTISLVDFMPASKRPVAQMQAELADIIASVADPDLQQLLTKIFSGNTLEQFSTAPAAKKMHHAYIGGLLEHTLSVTGLAEKIADHYPGLDRNILITGALLHDLAKIREFSFDALPFDYTDQGRLLGHLVIGVDMVRRAAADIDELSPQRLDQVCHLILSHHGRHEFGAPVLPMTQEAILLHHLDDMDAKMNYTDQLREKIAEPGYHWSDYQRPLERFLYLQSLTATGEKQPVTAEDPAIAAGPAPVPQKKSKPAKDDSQKRQQTLF